MIGDAAYESLWYDLAPNDSRILLFLIMRSQKQLTITVGRFTNLSLQQFANVSIVISRVRLKCESTLHVIMFTDTYTHTNMYIKYLKFFKQSINSRQKNLRQEPSYNFM